MEVQLENLKKNEQNLVISLVALYIRVEFECLSYVFMVIGIDDTITYTEMSRVAGNKTKWRLETGYDCDCQWDLK